MPIQTRCPACAAAVPSNAAWCSLCHADLRPRAVSAAATTIVPGRTTVTPASTVRESAPSVAGASSGRHSRGGQPAPEALVESASPTRGRHSAGGSRARVITLDLEDRPTGVAQDATQDEVEVLADQLLTRLALTEPRTRMLDPQDLPGGKWGFAAAATGGVVLVLLVLYTLLGLLFGR